MLLTTFIYCLKLWFAKAWLELRSAKSEGCNKASLGEVVVELLKSRKQSRHVIELDIFDPIKRKHKICDGL